LGKIFFRFRRKKTNETYFYLFPDIHRDIHHGIHNIEYYEPIIGYFLAAENFENLF